MLAVVHKEYDEKARGGEVARLEKKYGTIEHLGSLVNVNRCRDPAAVDDFMLWRVLRAEGGEVEERVTIPDAAFVECLTPKRMELLEHLRKRGAESIKLLAGKLGRDYKNVYDDIKALEKYELVELERVGKNMKPGTMVTRIVMEVEG